MNTIHTDITVSMAELCRDPNSILEEANPLVTILKHGHPMAYLVSAQAFENMMEALEDAELAEIVRQRRGGKTVKVTLDDL